MSPPLMGSWMPCSLAPKPPEPLQPIFNKSWWPLFSSPNLASGGILDEELPNPAVDEGEGLRDLGPRRHLAGEFEWDLDPERLREDLDRLLDLDRE